MHALRALGRQEDPPPVLKALQSDDLDPCDSGYPDDIEDFDILIEIDLCFKNYQANSVFFEFYVASQKALSRRPANSFMPPTLVLDEFNWNAIEKHVVKLLSHISGSKSWPEVAIRLSGQVRPVSMDCFPW